jgi:hypothetical protein
MNVERGQQASAITTLPTLGAGASLSADSSSLLPDPGAPGLSGIQDAMSMMYELVAQQGATTMSTGEIGVSAQNRAQESQEAAQEQAVKQEQQDEANLSCGSLWGALCHLVDDVTGDLVHLRIADAVEAAVSDPVNEIDSGHLFMQLAEVAPEVAQYAGVAITCAAAATVSVASFGTAAAAVIVGTVVALSASGLLVSKTGCLGKYSADIGMAMELTASVGSFGTAAVAGTAATFAAMTAATDATTGTLDAVSGASQVVVGHAEAAVDDDQGDVQQATTALSRSARIVDDLLQGLQDAQKSNEGAVEVLRGAIDTYDQGLTAASAGKA